MPRTSYRQRSHAPLRLDWQPRIPSFKGTRKLKANVRAALPAVEVYDADNIGTASDVDASAATTGYAGMTLALLQSYDGAVENVTVGSASSTTYCVKSTVGGKVWYKNGPSADIDNSTPVPAGC